MSDRMVEQGEISDTNKYCEADRSDKSLEVNYTLKALLYKSFKIQQRNYCSNVCQILTPLLCIAFTLLAQLISNQIISNKIQSFDFPQPLDFPYFYSVANRLNLSCVQNYIYEYNNTGKTKENVEKMFNHTLKYYCDQSDSLMPSYINTSNVNQFLMGQIKEADKESFQRGNDLKTNLPDGLVKFSNVTPNSLNVVFGINDLRLPEYHKNNGVTKISVKTGENQQISSYLRVTQGMMSLMQKINRAFLQLSHPKQIIMGSFMYMPFDGEDKSLKNKIINILGAGLYPLGLSLLLPLFLYAIVTEKEERLIEIMKMNGLNVKFYWVSSFMFNFGITLLMLVVFYCFGRFYLELTLFVETGVVVFWVLLIGWAIALISMTNFVQIFINSAKSATIIGYLLSIFSCFVGEAITTFIYAYPQTVPLPILFYPPFALCRAIYLIGFNCASNSSCYKDLKHVDSELWTIIFILYGWIFVYLLSIWLNEMIQQDYGVAQYPEFIKSCLRFFKRKEKKEELAEENYGEKDEVIQSVEFQMNQSTKFIISDPSSNLIDQSILQLKEKTNRMPLSLKPMVIKDLSKKYESETSTENKDYVALKPLTLYMEEKQIFGLLGPNGAGKTTMISVLTGMYPQSSGNAWINGLPIGSSATNKFIGVCPQFDLLWPDLTVYEHLKFYSILKMVKSEFIETQIDSLLKDVDLHEWKNTESSKLSGGMQRRLSLAISLVGNPKVVFLDEPSSGLDPSHRRQMWNILLSIFLLNNQGIKKRTSILLTTHLMEEAEVLCDRVGILSKGQLRCIGSIDELKEKFGKGYRLTISFSSLLKTYLKRKSSKSEKQISLNTENEMKSYESEQMSVSNYSESNSMTEENFRPQVVDLIIQKFNAEIINELNTRVILKIDKSLILECIELLKQEKEINWLVSQPSLYDVFVHFIK